MNSIQKEVISELVINKSTFINYLAPVHVLRDAQEYLQQIKEIHPDANHHCFAYILGDNQDIQKYSDDGEPSKTAGLPMLEVLKKNQLTDIISISVRYFGGVKLGAGGLVRAYTKSTSTAVEQSILSVKVSYHQVKISISFDLIGVCEQYIRDRYQLDHTEYDHEVHYTVTLPSLLMDQCEIDLTENTSGKVVITTLKQFEQYE